MRRLVVLLSLLLLLTDVAKADDKHAKVEQALRNKLMNDYNKYALPDAFTNVTFTGMDIRSFKLDETKNIMQMEAWLKYTWNDPRFTWNPEENLNISYLALSPDDIWIPDLVVYNAHGSRDLKKNSDVFALAYPDGRILHVPWYTYRFQCPMDLTYWPQDVQNCTLILGSWVHSGLIMDLTLDNYDVKFPGEDDNVMVLNISHSEFTIKDWSVTRLSRYYECCPEPYVSIWTSFIVARNAPAYTWTVKLPVVCLCVLTLVLFMLNPAAGEKVTFGGICLVLNFLYFHYVTIKIGDFAFNTPLIVQFLGIQLVLVIVCVFLSAFVLRMAKGPHVYGLPNVLRKPVANLANALFLGNYVDPKLNKLDDLEVGSGKLSANIMRSENSSLCEWVMLSAVVDRLALLFYLTICIINIVRFSRIL